MKKKLEMHTYLHAALFPDRPHRSATSAEKNSEAFSAEKASMEENAYHSKLSEQYNLNFASFKGSEILSNFKF